MNEELKSKVISMLSSGLNMNQVASILMVDRIYLTQLITETPVEGLSPEKPKKKTKVETETLFPDEPGL